MPFRILGEPWKTLGGQFGGILGSGSRGQLGVVFLFRDDFITAEAAPLTSPRTAKPGPGIGTIKDTGNNFSIVGGRLVSVGSVGVGDPLYLSQLCSRIAGLCGYGIIRFNTRAYIGWEGIIDEPKRSAISEVGGVKINIYDADVFIDTGITTDTTIEYETGNILRSAGAFHMIKEGVFTDWTLLWVSVLEVTASLRFGIANSVGIPLYDNLRISQLPPPWDTDFGIATDRLAGVRSAGDIFVHEADCLIEFEVTVFGGANAILFNYRIQDANNFWQVGVTAGGVLQIVEIIAGVPNVRANTGAGAIVGGERIVVVADNETIRYYIDNALTLTYALAANFKTETIGELALEGAGNSISDIISWPRVISRLARRALDRVANA